MIGFHLVCYGNLGASPAAPSNSAERKELHFGVFAYQGIEKTTKNFQPIVEYLDEAMTGYDVVIHVLPMEEIYRRIADQSLDFVTTNPTHFLVVRRQFPLTGVIATLMPLAPNGEPTQFLSGIILTKTERTDIKTLQDLAGKRIATPSTQHMGGFRAQAHELAQAGVTLQKSQLKLTAVHQDAVQALLRDEVDVAFVRNGILESMVASGELDLAQVRVIHPQTHPNFPMLSSTRLYPEWPVFALPHVEKEALRLLASALFSLEPDDPAAIKARIHGFTIPADYLVVEDLARSLRLPPFEDYGKVTLSQALREHWLLAVVIALLILTLLALLLAALYIRNRTARFAKEQAQLTATLQKSDARYEQFFAQSLSGFFFMTADRPLNWQDTEDKKALVDYALKHLRVTKVNPAMLAQYGAKEQNFLGITPAELFEFDSQLGENATFEILEKGRINLITHEKKLDGSPVIIEGDYVCIYNSEGHVSGIFGIQNDITEQVMTKEALAASEKRFKSILRKVKTVSVQGYLMDGTVTYWNDASTRMYGYTAEEAIGRNLLDLIIPTEMHDTVRQEIQTMQETGEPAPATELTLKRKDGSPLTVYSSHSLIHIPGKPSEFFCIDIDLTDRKQMEDKLRYAMHKAEAANRAKSEFLANMSHEIRTPMNGIIGMSELLQDTPLDKQQSQYLEIICSSGESLLHLIDDILDLSKMEAGKLKLGSLDFDLPDLLKVCVESFSHQARQKGLTLSSHMDTKIPHKLRGDAARLRQILVNLLSNALKFTEKGGIELSVSIESERTKSLLLRFAVSDTGIGIRPEEQHLLFEKFTQADSSSTREYGGTGLGLAICKQLVAMMKGEITVESSLGKGAVFSFTAQLEKQAASGSGPKAEAVAEEPGTIPSAHILLAEDNGTNRKVALQK